MERLEKSIFYFIQNRNKNEESTSIRNIHIRFGMDMKEIELILEEFLEKNLISKYYDEQYQEERYIPKSTVKE